MSVTLDARPHAVAVKAAIDAALGQWSAYDYDDVPGTNGNDGTLPEIYVEVTVERRYNPQLRSTATTGRSGWRVTARSVGRTVDEARWAMNRVTDALNEALLPVDGGTSTRVQFESDQAPELDDGRYSGLSVWTYSI